MAPDRQIHTKIPEISGNNLIADFLRSVHERDLQNLAYSAVAVDDFGLTGDEHASNPGRHARPRQQSRQ